MFLQRTQANTGDLKLLQVTLGYYRLLHVSTDYYMLLESYYRVFQVTTGYYGLLNADFKQTNDYRLNSLMQVIGQTFTGCSTSKNTLFGLILSGKKCVGYGYFQTKFSWLVD